MHSLEYRDNLENSENSDPFPDWLFADVDTSLRGLAFLSLLRQDKWSLRGARRSIQLLKRGMWVQIS